jgi:EpsI family protein
VTLTARVVVVSACLCGAAIGVSAASRTEKIPMRAPLAELPSTIGDWHLKGTESLDSRVLAVLRPDDYIMRSYGRGSADFAGLYIGYHGSQRQGDSIHSPLNCLPGSGWIPVALGHAVLTVPSSEGSSRQIEVNRVVIEKGTDRDLVYYWYQSHDRVTASEYWGKFYTVVDAIRLARTDAALVRVVVPLRNADEGAADRAAVSFINALFPQLPRYLPS